MSEEWREVYVHRCERGFYDQDGAPEVTIPKDTQVFWLEDKSAEGKRSISEETLS